MNLISAADPAFPSNPRDEQFRDRILQKAGPYIDRVLDYIDGKVASDWKLLVEELLRFVPHPKHPNQDPSCPNGALLLKPDWPESSSNLLFGKRHPSLMRPSPHSVTQLLPHPIAETAEPTRRPANTIHTLT